MNTTTTTTALLIRCSGNLIAMAATKRCHCSTTVPIRGLYHLARQQPQQQALHDSHVWDSNAVTTTTSAASSHSRKSETNAFVSKSSSSLCEDDEDYFDDNPRMMQVMCAKYAYSNQHNDNNIFQTSSNATNYSPFRVIPATHNNNCVDDYCAPTTHSTKCDYGSINSCLDEMLQHDDVCGVSEAQQQQSSSPLTTTTLHHYYYNHGIFKDG